MSSATSSAQKQQRARQVLSCTACRSGKLRCDRQSPCDQCLKRSKDGDCHYLSAPSKKKQSRNTKDRIAHLEGLVVQLMGRDVSNGSSDSGGTFTGRGMDGSNGSVRPPTGLQAKESPQSDDSAESATQEISYMKIGSGGRSSYRGGSHWEAILSSIEDLKHNVDDDENEDEDELEPIEEDNRSASLIIIGAPATVTREILLEAIPPKSTVDRLLWHWFNSTDPGSPAIHRPTFLQQYDALWRDPSTIPTMWLSILFSIMALGSRIAAFGVTDDTTGGLSDELNPARFQELAASALALADFTKPQRYLIEALMAHSSCEYMKFVPTNQLWLMMGLIIRVALKMGYHRDGDNFPNISVFDAEMRRRVWNIVFTFDVLQSYQEGLPNMIQQVHSDTKPPSNLFDTDFGPETKVLPPSRPLTELSPISYGVVKNKLSKVFARACNLSQNIQTPAYDEIMQMDREIQEVYDQTPPALRFSSMNQAILDPPNLIFNRFKLELMFHKVRCVLHRPYMTQAVIGTQAEPSRTWCVAAAMSILTHHEAIFEAAKDGGQLSQSRFHISSLNSADFLLAAMILCLELHLISKAPSPALAGPNQEKIGEMRRLIETSYTIWKQPSSHFGNTEKAVKAMEKMLSEMPPATDSTTTTYTPPDQRAMFTNDQIAAMSGIYAADLSNTNTLFDPITLPLNPGTTDIDWDSWDKTIHENVDPNIDLGWPEDTGDIDMNTVPNFGVPIYANDTTPLWPSMDLMGAGILPFQSSKYDGGQ